MRAVNLIPSEQRSGQPVGAGRSHGAAYAVLALIAGLALMAYLYGQAKHQLSSRRAQAATLTAEAQRAQAAAERLAPYTSFIALREQRVQAVDALVNERFDWAHVMHEFGRVLPAQTSIASLTGSIGGSSSASSTSASSTGSVPMFTLSGCATSQPAVALTLERLHLIDGVSEVTLQASTAGSAGTASSSSSSSSSGAGGCTGSDASFSATVTFDPLPGASAASGATSTSVADQTGSAATTTAAKPTSSGAIAR
jgi:Tfp pilus assembly protein PilN